MKSVEKILIITSVVLFLTVIVSLFSVVVAVHLIGVSNGGDTTEIVDVITCGNTPTDVVEETVTEHSTALSDEEIETPVTMTCESTETPVEISTETEEPSETSSDMDIHSDSAVLRITYADDTYEMIVCQRTSTAHEIMEYLYTFDNVVSISVFPTTAS